MLIHHLGLRVNSDVPADTLEIWRDQGWHAGPHPDTDPDAGDIYEPGAVFVPPVLLAVDAEPVPEPFDPSAHIAADVVTYLNEATDTERARVIEAEVNGKARKSVVEWTPPPAEETSTPTSDTTTATEE